MKPAPFSYMRPVAIDDALNALSQYGEDCKILAGGQSLLPMMNLRVLKPERIIDINRLTELDYIRVEGGSLHIGALSRHTTLYESQLVAEHCPLMSEAYRSVAHQAVRNRGTIGGNLSHAYPASEMPAIMQAVGATMVVRSSAGQREVAATDFFVGSMETALREDELLVEIRIPFSPRGQGWSFLEVSTREGDFALAGIGVTLQLENGNCKNSRVVYCGISENTGRFYEVEDMLNAQKAGEDLFRRAGEMASQLVEMETDYHADADYRQDLVKTLIRRTLLKALERCL